MFQVIARSEGIQLSFTSSTQKLLIHQDTAALISGLSDLLYKVLNVLPANNHISVRVEANEQTEARHIRIIISNSGMSLAKLTELNNHLKFSITELPEAGPGTLFETKFFIGENASESTRAFVSTSCSAMPLFYAEIRKRFSSHFYKADQLVANLSNINPREASFLTKINSLIVQNISNPKMDANFISDAMNMSRTQLFRRLKPIIRQSPGHYIKTLKLQKAKELFQTTDLRINEVAFRMGFESPGSFTKAFVRQFGVKPSLFCRQQMSK